MARTTDGIVGEWWSERIRSEERQGGVYLGDKIYYEAQVNAYESSHGGGLLRPARPPVILYLESVLRIHHGAIQGNLKAGKPDVCTGVQYGH